MTALKIALLGAPGTGVMQFAGALRNAVQAPDWQAFVVEIAGDPPAPSHELAGFDLLLLMGLESAYDSPGLPVRRQTPDLAHEAADQSIRAALALAAVPYRVLYGAAEERLAHALHALERLLLLAEARPSQSAHAKGVKTQPWVWMCDKCSDPQCEHRLLTALLAQRAGTA